MTGGHAWWRVCMAGGSMTGGMRDRGHACHGVHGRGCKRGSMHGREGHAWQGVYGRGNAWQCGRECVAGETATAADGTYPTGMHSC